MLPISVGSPLILSGKKRPQRRRLEPESARPRGGSAAAGFAGRAVVDPALPAHSQGPAAGTTRFPRERLRAARPAERGGKEGPRTRGARPPAPTRRLPAPPGLAAVRSFLTRKIVRRRDPGCAGAGRSVRGLRVRPRHVAASGALPPRALRAAGAAPRPNKAETPRRRELWCGDAAALRAAAGRCACVVSAPSFRRGPSPAPPPPGGPERRVVASPGARPSAFLRSPRPAGGREGSSAGGFKNTEPLIGL